MCSWRKANSVAVLVSVGAAAVYGVWVTTLPPFSTRATVGVLAGGAAAVVWGRWWRRRSPGHDRLEPGGRAQPVGLAVWGVLVASLAGWQLAAWLQHPRSEHPTISSIIDQVLEGHPVRAGAFVVWLAIAAWFAHR